MRQVQWREGMFWIPALALFLVNVTLLVMMVHALRLDADASTTVDTEVARPVSRPSSLELDCASEAQIYRSLTSLTVHEIPAQ